jgi:hypothetical protein
MIIKFPTGFYKTVLPQVPSDSTSVTFTISNNLPPRTELFFPKIPTGIEGRQRLPETTFDRSEVGDLIFTISEASNSEIDNNARLLEIGQIIEFTNNRPGEVDPMFVAPLTEVRHDTSKFDYSEMGLDAEDIIILESVTSQKLFDLQDQLNQAKTQRANAEQVIATQQKLINNLDRNIAALELVTDVTDADDDVVEVLQKLIDKREAALAVRDAAVVGANDSAAEAARLVDELRTTAAVVK